MAPFFKTSFALLSLSSLALSVRAGGSGSFQQQPKHLKMVKRTLFEELDARDSAPFGYDRCGRARSKPYVRKPNASPKPSGQWKPCPPDTPVGRQHAQPTGSSPGSPAAIPTAAPASSDDSDSSSSSSSVYSTEYDDDEYTYSAEPVAALASTADSSSWTASSHAADVTSSSHSYTYVASTTSSSSSSSSSSSHASAESDYGSAPASTATYVAAAVAHQKFVPESSASDDYSATSTWSSTAAAATTAVASSSSSGGGSLGVGWSYLNPSGALAAWEGAGKVYTWSAYPPSDSLPSGMEWYPQYWCTDKQSEFEAQVSAGNIYPGMTILGFNEPDQSGQCNMGVSDAVAAYKSLLTPYASKGYKLATPATTSDDNGFNWISQFVAECNGECGFTYLQTHYYGVVAQDFIDYIQKLYDSFGLPIIVSEYSAMDFTYQTTLSQDEVNAYVATTQNWLKAQSFIESYFYFGPVVSSQAGGVNSANLMIEDSGAINALGSQYLATGK